MLPIIAFQRILRSSSETVARIILFLLQEPPRTMHTVTFTVQYSNLSYPNVSNVFFRSDFPTLSLEGGQYDDGKEVEQEEFRTLDIQRRSIQTRLVWFLYDVRGHTCFGTHCADTGTVQHVHTYQLYGVSVSLLSHGALVLLGLHLFRPSLASSLNYVGNGSHLS